MALTTTGKPSGKTTAAKIGAGCLIGFGAFSFIMTLFTFGALLLEQKAERSTVGDVLAMILMLAIFAAIIWFGVRIIRQQRVKAVAFEKSEDSNENKTVLKLAVAKGGRITLAQVVAHTELTLDEGRETLERLVTEGVAQVDVNDDGVIEYVITGL